MGLGGSGGASQWWTVQGEGTGRSGWLGWFSWPSMGWPLVSVLEVGACPEAVRWARRHARGRLGAWGVPEELVADAEVLTSELITNAIAATLAVDAAEPVALRLLANGERVVIEAWDCHPGSPGPAPCPVPDGESECGRGLAIVHELAIRWGTRRLSANVKAVWAELLLPAGRQEVQVSQNSVFGRREGTCLTRTRG